MNITWPIIRADDLGTGDVLDFGDHLSKPFWHVVAVYQFLGGIYVKLDNGMGWEMGWMFDRNSLTRRRLVTP